MTGTQLYPFQVTGIRVLEEKPRVLLADEMGLGKTVQAAVALGELCRSGAVRRALVVCPASLCLNWKRELAKWGRVPGVIYEGADRFGLLYGNATVLIGSYETIAGDLRQPTSDGTIFHDIGVDVVIVDEAQRIKAPDSLRSKVLGKLLGARRWAITGTPVENHPRELASILRFLFPNEFSTDAELEDLGRILAHRDTCLLRRTKSRVGLELPHKSIGSVTISLRQEQKAEYTSRLEALKKALKGSGGRSQTLMHVLAGIQDLRRIAVVSSKGQSAKLDYLEDEIENVALCGEKAVIFSSFANIALPLFQQRLQRFGSVMYTGNMTAEQRQASENKFLTDPHTHVMCASLKAAGVGLTWTAATYVFHADVWWNPQVLNQADDRVHRIGQTKPVFIRRLLADETIEVAIDQLLEAKEDIFKIVVDEAPATAAGPRALSELLAMIGLTAADVL